MCLQGAQAYEVVDSAVTGLAASQVYPSPADPTANPTAASTGAEPVFLHSGLHCLEEHSMKEVCHLGKLHEEEIACGPLPPL